VPTTAVDAITLAFAHTRRSLFTPFRWGQWLRLAVVGMLSGEMGGGGGCNYMSSFRPPTPSAHHAQLQGLLAINMPAIAGVAAALVVCALGAFLLFIYVNSRMRFVLFDSVVRRECHIRQYWSQRAEPALGYFVWQLLFGLATIAVLAVVVGPPLMLAAAGGWFSDPGAHLTAVILTAAVVFIVFFSLIVTVGVIHVLTKDFVVPQMALEGVTVREGWARLWARMSSEKVAYAAYIGMKIVMTIATTIMISIVGVILALIVLIPVGGVGAIAVIGGAAAGMTWNAVTIAIAVAVCGTVVLALIFIFAMISVPLVVFYPAYSFHFLAGRYPPLQTALTTQG
jgi:hypothetical protein